MATAGHSRQRVADYGPTVSWADPLVWIIAVFAILDFVYAVSFNLLPDEVRLVIIGTLFLGQGLLGIASLLFRIDLWRIRVFGLIILLVSVWLISHAVLGNPFQAEIALRRLAPVLAALLFIGFADKLPSRFLAFGACASIAFAVVWAALQPSYFHGSGSDLSRFAPFHGGDEKNAHASSYIILACVLITHQALLGRQIPKTLGWGFVAAGVVLIVGYWSSQVQLALVAYFGVHTLMYKRVSWGTRFIAGLVFVGIVGALIIEKESRGLEDRGAAAYEASSAGTGRVGTWIDRIDRLQNRNATQLLIGEGIATDNYSSPTWPKLTHSHNLILTYMLEAGVVGTIVLHAIILAPLAVLGRPYLPFLAAMLAGSLVGSGIMHRAMAYMLFWLAVGMMVQRVQFSPHLQSIPSRLRGGLRFAAGRP